MDILISLRKDISDALVPRLKTPEEQMHFLTGTIQRTEVALKDNERFYNNLNVAFVNTLVTGIITRTTLN